MKKTNILISTLAAMIVSLASAGEHMEHKESGHGHHGEKHMKSCCQSGVQVKSAIAVVQSTASNTVTGTVYFKKVDGGIRVKGEIHHLTPGKHGFHVHQYGDLTKSDGTAMGGHFNPTDHPHSGPDSKMRHVGDLGNIVADETGTAVFDFVDPKLSFCGGKSILGRGLIIHAGEDDLESQPTGAAGARVGMAVIGVLED